MPRAPLAVVVMIMAALAAVVAILCPTLQRQHLELLPLVSSASVPIIGKKGKGPLKRNQGGGHIFKSSIKEGLSSRGSRRLWLDQEEWKPRKTD